MIHLYRDKAYMAIDYGCVMSDLPRLYNKYLVYSFKHNEKSGWQINNMQITIEEGLIINE
jgi:hypothetical protein